jgi:exodeoxyribonuclease-3
MLLVKNNHTVNKLFFGFGRAREFRDRVITAHIDDMIFIGIYAQNSGVDDLSNIAKRKKFDAHMLAYLKKVVSENAKKKIIFCGDFNVAAEDIDVYNPDAKRNKKAGFMDFERENFNKYLALSFIDAFRHKYPRK